MSAMTPPRIGRYIRAAWQSHVTPDRALERALAGLVGTHVASGRLQLVRHDTTLVAVCRDRALCTEMRFQQREILKTLQAAGYPEVERVRVALGGAARSTEPDPVRSRPPIPDSARQTLEQTAGEVDDPRLAGALRRLARARPRDTGNDTG